jgi:hypothetical protein
MFELLAKTAIGAALAVLGVVVSLPATAPKPETPANAQTISQDQIAEQLRRLEIQAQVQQNKSARLSGKLDLLLEQREGNNATVRPRPKPER